MTSHNRDGRVSPYTAHMALIDVSTTSAHYAIHIEPGLITRVGEMIRAVAPAGRAMLVADEALVDLYVAPVSQSLSDAGFETIIGTVEADEIHKSLLSVNHLYGAALKGNLERSSPIIALGGGVIGDLAGFAAATFMRGVPFVQIPTTLLAMVDASIGGKTGVNLPMPSSDDAAAPALAKNLVGAFWQPRVVLIDPNVLATLDRRHFNCGLAECIKHAILADRSLLEFIGEHASALQELNQAKLLELITRCAQIKADVVAADEREAGPRALLNLGHTFAHVIEPISELGLHHGEAVAIGLCAAAHCARMTDRLSEDDAKQIEQLISVVDLPTQLPRPIAVDTLMRAMLHDKKVQAGQLRLVLPTSIGSAEIINDVPDNIVRDSWKAVAASP